MITNNPFFQRIIEDAEYEEIPVEPKEEKIKEIIKSKEAPIPDNAYVVFGQKPICISFDEKTAKDYTRKSKAKGVKCYKVRVLKAEQ